MGGKEKDYVKVVIPSWKMVFNIFYFPFIKEVG